jgi:hypothetical protein
MSSAFRGHSLSRSELRSLARVLPPGLGLGDTIYAAIKGGGSYQPIMLHVVENRPAVLFRLITADGGLNYHDVILAGTSSTGPKIVDIFLYAAGEYYTESMARMLTGRGSRFASRFVDLLQGKSSVKPSPVSAALDSMRACAERGEHERALRLYTMQPESVRHDKLVLIERAQIAIEIESPHADAAVRDMRRLFPNDNGVNLQLIDYYFIRGAYDSTISAIDRLDKAVDGDPYLAFLRANIYRVKEDTANMKLWAMRAVQGDPSLHYPYWILLDLSLLRKDYTSTAKYLRSLEKYARYNIDELMIDEDPAYAGFVASDEFAKWSEWHRRRMSPEQEEDEEEGLEQPEIDVPPQLLQGT